MCTDGVNRGQLQFLLEIAEEQTAAVSGWMKEIAHQAGHADVAGDEIAAATASLKAAPSTSGVEVTVV